MATAHTSSAVPSPQNKPTVADVTNFSLETSALRQGIKSIAVGKYGEKPIPTEIIPSIARELNLVEEIPDHLVSLELLFLRASFLGSLFMKQSLSVEEHQLLLNSAVLPRTNTYAAGKFRLPDSYVQPQHNDSMPYRVTAGHIIATVASSDESLINSPMSKFAFRLLYGEQLDMSEAEILGNLLYADEPVTPMKALIAHVMRVRHENSAEICGLARSIASSTTVLPALASASVRNDNEKAYIFMAEPFDGVVTWDLLTPLVARHLQNKYGFRVVVAAGESSGPKYGPNVLSLYSGLRDVGLYGGGEAEEELGLVSDQAVTNKGTARWVHMRRVILKRPALATVEKYADSCPGGRAKMFIGSAFHPGYVEKMGDAAEAVGFPSYIIISKGMEGCIGQGVGGRESKILVGWKVKNEKKKYEFKREEIKYKYDDLNDYRSPVKNEASVEDTVERISGFVRDGSSGNRLFDSRVHATCQALDRAMSLIQKGMSDTKFNLNSPI